MPPVVSGVSPQQGSNAGGTPVTITGSGFTGVTSAKFGTNMATNMGVVSDTQINATTPPGQGSVNVTVSGPSGTSSQFVFYTYVAVAAPVISSLNPNGGPVAGGTPVTITGTGFTGATSVKFGSTSAAFSVVSSTQITATSPPSPGPGPCANVTVSGPGGVSNAVPYSYSTSALTPIVTSLAPDQGPVTGGNTVAVNGAHLSLASSVLFGGVPATPISVVNDNQLLVPAPGGSGSVQVTVTTPGGTSAPNAGSVYTYVAVPIVTGLNPNQGPSAGGSRVTISGSRFTYAIDVLFGTVPASFSVVSDNHIVAVAPAGTGSVNVTVASVAGTSSPGLPYTYL
ncbi:IPT/TIG domain-containing protein [Streptosporangium sp. NPDC000396]|uniref:IPT/TIG domain-containing protein n=1 Tax=Streptosporangium sp. NPDC000396 TaxID=3366185 RepID=UPI0036B89356